MQINGKRVVIRIVPKEGSPRICDYCSVMLVDKEAFVLDDCFLTEYGLMCRVCLGDIRPIKSYHQGESVLNESWY